MFGHLWRQEEVIDTHDGGHGVHGLRPVPPYVLSGDQRENHGPSKSNRLLGPILYSGRGGLLAHPPPIGSFLETTLRRSPHSLHTLYKIADAVPRRYPLGGPVNQPASRHSQDHTGKNNVEPPTPFCPNRRTLAWKGTQDDNNRMPNVYRGSPLFTGGCAED